MKKLLLSMFLVGICSGVMAQEVSKVANERKEPTPEMKAAFKACRESVKKEENGHPNREEMRSCLESKGFKRPNHPHTDTQSK